MLNIEIANILVFQRLNIDIEQLDELDQNRLYQRKMFLLQTLGIDLGYSFIWSFNGVYSPDLYEYYHDNAKYLKSETITQEIKESTKQIIDIVNSLDSEKPNDIDTLLWYELLASMIYITSIEHSFKVNSKLVIFYQLYAHKKNKPSMAQFLCAYTALCNNGFESMLTQKFKQKSNLPMQKSKQDLDFEQLSAIDFLGKYQPD